MVHKSLKYEPLDLMLLVFQVDETSIFSHTVSYFLFNNIYVPSCCER